MDLAEKPEILGANQVFYLTARENNTVILPCKVSGYPIPSITWSKTDGQIGDVGSRGVTTLNGLIIDHVKAGDSGTYRCHVESALGVVEKTVQLTVSELKPKINVEKEYVGVKLGQTAQNKCEIKAADHYSLKYTKVYGHLPIYTVQNDGRMLFTLNSQSETGEYRCTATTDTGSLSETFYGAGPLCLKCNYAINPDECEQVTRCGDHEECYMQQFVTPGGHILYDLGCKDKYTCDNFNRTAQPIFAGKRNAEDLDDYIDARTVFLPDLKGGRFCFHCDQQFGVDGCDRITMCPQDRNCTSRALAYANRCNACCSGSFCNNKCVKATLPPTPPTTSTSTTTTTTTLPPTTTQPQTPPNIVTISVNPQHVQKGDHVSVTCIATGNPPPKIVWEMLASPGHVPTNVHGDNQFPARLVIDGFDPKLNAMQYRCYAHNLLGTVNKTISVP
ncbi:hypothetical protein FSP39_017187 [Pinctada imbricata]|uniref:Ig-like domain-containing protein n=1 Tax=Pinctada imbricata TaxID=66713 RepID=A0AA88Y5A5_PINIB|nr:hypothetical protein FSP39_017187 [Pinctada imbricata]